jgi:hypothetical protein
VRGKINQDLPPPCGFAEPLFDFGGVTVGGDAIGGDTVGNLAEEDVLGVGEGGREGGREGGKEEERDL